MVLSQLKKNTRFCHLPFKRRRKKKKKNKNNKNNNNNNNDNNNNNTNNNTNTNTNNNNNNNNSSKNASVSARTPTPGLAFLLSRCSRYRSSKGGCIQPLVDLMFISWLVGCISTVDGLSSNHHFFRGCTKLGLSNKKYGE